MRREGVQTWGTSPFRGQAVRRTWKNWAGPVSEAEENQERVAHLDKRRKYFEKEEVPNLWHTAERSRKMNTEFVFALSRLSRPRNRGWKRTEWDGQRIDGDKWKQRLWWFWEVLLRKGVEGSGRVSLLFREVIVRSVCSPGRMIQFRRRKCRSVRKTE